jgi:hypothetical protein
LLHLIQVFANVCEPQCELRADRNALAIWRDTNECEFSLVKREKPLLEGCSHRPPTFANVDWPRDQAITVLAVPERDG